MSEADEDSGRAVAPADAPAESVAATLTGHEAASRHWHVVIVGAGPAGAATAIRLARAGLRVLLLDRGVMPRPKVCGCCLSSAALAEIAALNLSEVPGGIGLAAVTVASGGRAVRLRMPRGLVVSRESLDTTLVRQAIAVGCEWLPRATVLAVEESGAAYGSARAIVACEGENQGLHAACVVIATGLVDSVRTAVADGRTVAAGSRVGLGAVLEPGAADIHAGELIMAVAAGGYCGVVRLEDGRIDVAAAIDRRAVAVAGPAAAALQILEEACGREVAHLRAAAVRAASFRATPPLTRSAAVVAGQAGRILRVGDAAGYVEPFTGEGIGWALASARIAAEALSDQQPADRAGLRPPADWSARYRVGHAAHFGPLHARCRWLSRVLRRPMLVQAAVGAARLTPAAAAWLLPTIIGAGDARAD